MYYGSGKRVKFELDLSNYATKSDLMKATSVDAKKICYKGCFKCLKNKCFWIRYSRVKICSCYSKKLGKVLKHDALKSCVW